MCYVNLIIKKVNIKVDMHFLSNKYKINCKSIFNIFGLLQFINKSRNDCAKNNCHYEAIDEVIQNNRI